MATATMFGSDPRSEPTHVYLELVNRAQGPSFARPFDGEQGAEWEVETFFFLILVLGLK